MLQLLLTLVLAVPAAPDLRAEVGAAFAEAVDRADSRVETEERLRGLRAAAAEAASRLEGQRVALLIEEAVLDARWRALVDPYAAAEELAERLAALASDLRFEPLMEADLPPGFPEPTPVHELRLVEYPGYRLAFAELEGAGDGSAFFELFRHIQSNGIAMTAPVEVTFEAERLEPVRMAFLYEGPDQGAVGSAGEVEVVDVPPQSVLSLGCRGRDSLARVERMWALLEDWLEDHPEWEADGPPRTMGYNSPMVPSARRCFEVQVPVRRVEPADELREA